MTADPTAPVAAREIIEQAIDEGGFAYRHSHIREATDAILARLRANGYVVVRQEPIDVLLMAADWAEQRIEVRENPLHLALVNFRAALTDGGPE